jgi:hypothetical protein
MKRTSLVSIIVAALVMIGIVVYLVRPRTDESESARPRDVPGASQPSPETPSVAAAPVSCTGPVTSQVPIASLASHRQWARSLLVSNQVEPALAELRKIAILDPGYPGINLEIADALLKSKHPGDAKDAIRLQIEISECLAALPAKNVEDYCKSQWATEPKGGCVAQLAGINQEAHYQSGRVDAELTRPAEPRTAPATVAVASPTPRVVAPSSPAPTAAATPAPVAGTADTTASALPAAVAAPAAIPVTPSVVLPPIDLKTTEASGHVGELARVCGTIATKRTADTAGKPTFINLDRPYPNQTFTVLVWDKDVPAVGTLPETGSLCVTGTVVMYRGTPEVILYDAKSWSQ